MVSALRKTGFLLAAAVLLLVAASPSQAARLKLSSSVSTAKSGKFELRLSLAARTSQKAACRATVRAGKQLLTLPQARTVHRRVSWRWVVPAGAPSGQWRFVTRCSRQGQRTRKVVRAFVLTPSSDNSASLAAPGTVSVRRGRYVQPSKRQSKKVTAQGGKGAANPGERGYCTWGAWNLAPWLGAGVSGNANNWYVSAQRNGLPVGDVPVVGAVFVRTSGRYGHVGVVTRVISPVEFETMEMNGGSILPKTDYKTTEFNKYVAHRRYTAPDMKFIYKPGTQPGAWNSQIVQWDGDTKSQKTAWYVGPDGKRRWIPDIATYWCLKRRGVPGPTALPSSILDQYPDLNGQWVSCSDRGGIGAGSGPPPADPAPVAGGEGSATTAPGGTPTGPSSGGGTVATPPPAPRTWTQQQGSLGANTFTNPYNASGMGAKIPAMAYVQVSCKVYAPQIVSANPDGYWYRIASAPWNNQYYAVANTFWNGDIPGQKPYTHNTDWAVPNC